MAAAERVPALVWAVVVAAGDGRRFGAPKQFARLGNRLVVEWSIAAARAAADGVVVVVPSGAGPGTGGEAAFGADLVVAGGSTRAASVRAGLVAVPSDTDVVVVHDGARPLATPELFMAVVDAVVAGADAAVPGLAIADTVKRVDRGEVVETLSRDGLVAIQTPQAFRAEVLRGAHQSETDATDDAALVERMGATVRVVPGDPRNLKVTTMADLEMAQALAGR